MTANTDAILLFKKPNWRGGVMFRRGIQDISKLGSPKEGGRNTFGNNVASARITPFHIHLNVTIVTQSDGTLPGTFSSLRGLSGVVNSAVAQVNRFYQRQQALLIAHISHFNQRVHNNKYNLGNFESARFPASWKNQREIDVIFVNSFDDSVTGRAKKPWRGKVCIVAMRRNGSGGTQRNSQLIGRTIAHEIGHFLGSDHTRDNRTNIMSDLPRRATNINVQTATFEQIQEWHTKLSRNLTRRRNRKEA
jgi:predicted Zn-dependent protease